MEPVHLSLKEVYDSLVETGHRLERMSKEREKTERMIEKMFKEVGGISNNNGAFAEEYFENAFEHDKTFGDIHFDNMQTNISVKDRDHEDEYDIVLYNDKNIAIIETKYKAHEKDIEQVLKKADSFRQWFPKYKNHKIYLGLASLSFNNRVMDRAKEEGIAIIRQRGGKTIVSDKNLKAY